MQKQRLHMFFFIECRIPREMFDSSAVHAFSSGLWKIMWSTEQQEQNWNESNLLLEFLSLLYDVTAIAYYLFTELMHCSPTF